MDFILSYISHKEIWNRKQTFLVTIQYKHSETNLGQLDLQRNFKTSIPAESFEFLAFVRPKQNTYNQQRTVTKLTLANSACFASIIVNHK